MHKVVEDLVNWTNEDVEVAAKGIDNADDWRVNPAKAIRFFYPRLFEMNSEHHGYGCACFAPNEFESMKLLHFNFLSSANVFDIHPGCTTSEIFKERYGLFPHELAAEVAAKRALVFLNAHPSTISDDEAHTLTPLMDRALGAGRLQLTSIRHAAFKKWLCPDLETDKEGQKIYEDYFAGCLHQPKDVREAVFGNPGLRLGFHPDEPNAEVHLEGVVKGRWDHIRRFDSSAADSLAELLPRTNDYVERSILLTAVKDTVAAPITMAKGGLYRMSPPQIAQQRAAVRIGRTILGTSHARLGGTQKEIDRSGLLPEFIRLILPDIDLPVRFTWEDCNELRVEGYFDPIHQGIAKAMELASKQMPEKDQMEVVQEIASDYERHRKAFSRYAKFRKLFETAERYGGAFLTLSADLILKFAPPMALFVTDKLRPVLENQPGVHLAYGVFRAKQTHEAFLGLRK